MSKCRKDVLQAVRQHYGTLTSCLDDSGGSLMAGTRFELGKWLETEGKALQAAAKVDVSEQMTEDRLISGLVLFEYVRRPVVVRVISSRVKE